ncbi:MAG: broad specificity phosphatase PhoE [Myxococcota bacterium]|jgi:broad specificity phosphatase PhoE
MSRLFLVRHGQASFFSSNYDQLSDLGRDQARRLGAWWSGTGQPQATRLVSGPLVRQRDSHAEFVTGAGVEHPHQLLDGLSEYHALELMTAVIPTLVNAEPELAEIALAAVKPGEGQGAAKERLFRTVTRRWVRGELENPVGIQSFDAFRAGVEDALETMVEANGPGETTVAFTSGGVVAAAVGWVLGLDHEKTLELSWVVRNSAVTELRHRFIDGQREVSVFVFNATPHLPSADLITYR